MRLLKLNQIRNQKRLYQPKRNQIVLEGIVIETNVLRYTPGGVPFMEMRVQHSSRQCEAGLERDVTVTLSVFALGDPALAAATIKIGQSVAVKGFLSQRSLKSEYPVLHINQIKLLEENHATSTC
jgi:primosomal replication protein N